MPDVARYPLLFSPLEMRGRKLRNRIVMTAHTTSLAEGGIAGERMRRYWGERAEGGVGMVVTEPVPAHPTARHAAANFLIDDDRTVLGMHELGEALHARDTVVIGQIYHPGSFANPLISGRETWAPSADRRPLTRHPAHAVSRGEIAEVVGGFTRAARRHADADLDGVEILMAFHGFIDSFFYPLRNTRADDYGGSLQNRLRVAVEVLLAVREDIGSDRILGITITGEHFNDHDFHIEDSAAIAVELAERAELDYIAIANGDQVTNRYLIPGMEIERGFGVKWASIVKRALPNVVVTAEGRIQSAELAESALAAGAADLIGMARALIADPQLPLKSLEGRESEIALCIACNQGCLGKRRHNLPLSCLQNPAAGHESLWGTTRIAANSDRRRVLVIGGGPAGLEAAVTAARLGHAVDLLERSGELGGQARLAARLPFCQEFEGVYAHREYLLQALGVRVHLHTEADVDSVVGFSPEFVILATGSEPTSSGAQPALEGPPTIATEARSTVYSSVDILKGASLPAGDVVMLDGDGHRKAVGTAEYLAQMGLGVTVVSSDPVIGSQLVAFGALEPAMERLASLGVRLVPASVLIAWDCEGARIRNLYDGSEVTISAATLVLATEHAATDQLRDPLEASGFAVSVVGDACAPRLMEQAISDGFRAALDVDAAARSPRLRASAQ